jgi:translocation and assembly module TamB
LNRAALLLAVGLWPAVAAAQTDERGYLTALLEDNLSTVDAKVTITGFAGALSSRASVQKLTIADKEGVWLTLTDVALDWNRAALFSGVVEVTALTAAEILVDRLPVSSDAGPSAEAAGFSLPELPVSVTIGQILAEKIVLGETVLGESVEARLDASMQLAGGEGNAKIQLERTDDKIATISMDGSYVNATGVLQIDLSAIEQENGLAVRLLGVPGAPSAEFTVEGAGPIEAFNADISLKTDEIVRLAGNVQLTGDGAGTNSFNASLGGDLAPVFLPAYADFFGPEVNIAAAGSRDKLGKLALSVFRIQAAALDLYGSAALAPDGVPERFDITGKLGLADGSPLLLPLTTEMQTRVTAGALSLRYDSREGEGWSGSADLTGLDRTDFKADRATLKGSGRISRTAEPTVGATVTFAAFGLAPSDPALAQALGSEISGTALGYWQQGDGETRLSRLIVQGEDYDLTLSGSVQGLADGLTVQGTADVMFDDLSRFSTLAGQPLAGAGRIGVRGAGSPLSGQFDVTTEVVGTNLKSGIAQVDGLLRGKSRIDASVLRDETGTTLREVRLTGNQLNLSAQGRLVTGANDVTADLRLGDLSVLGARYRGVLTGQVRLLGDRVTLDGRGQGLAVGQAQADRLLRGDSTVKAAVLVTDAGVQVEQIAVDNPQVGVTAQGNVGGGISTITLQARLANLGILLPEFPGALMASGTAVDDGNGLVLDLRGTGPGQIDAAVAGRISGATANLTITGTAQAALANAFIDPRAVSGGLRMNLTLQGPLALGSLNGTVALDNGRIADPTQNFALENVAAQAVLSGGSARIEATASVSSGGSLAVRGSVGLTNANPAALAVDLSQVTLRDPDFYETTVNGALTVDGPLAGGAVIAGRLALTETELRIPSTGFGGSSDLPGLVHLRDPADVRATRARAGLLGEAISAGVQAGRAFGLNLVISAPNRVFIRGRGLDAELGGQLTLTGTTAAIVPFGAFDLIRGRLDILGRRLDLTRARLQMEGALVPFLSVLASSEGDGYVTSVQIEGTATEPEVSFTSTPDLPEEEVLARLLFGQGLQNLSAFQAAQLAGAVANLAGRGGEGLMSRLRRGIGLDNLDVQTDAVTGAASVTAGKYLTEKIYTEVTVEQDGESRIDLNLDVARHITLKAGSGSDGSSGIGIFLERDY